MGEQGYGGRMRSDRCRLVLAYGLDVELYEGGGDHCAEHPVRRSSESTTGSRKEEVKNEV
jgi:hypothetical protein